MSCAHVRDLYSPYLEGELDADDRAQFEAHVNLCEPCSERLGDLESAMGAIADLPRHPVPRSFAEDVLAKVAADTPGAAESARPFPWVAVGRWAAGVLLGITLCLAGIQLFMEVGPDPDVALVERQRTERQLQAIQGALEKLESSRREQQAEFRVDQEKARETLRALGESHKQLEGRIAENANALDRSSREREALLEQRIDDLAKMLVADRRSNDAEIDSLKREIIIAISERGMRDAEPTVAKSEATTEQEADAELAEGEGLTRPPGLGLAVEYYWEDDHLVWQQDKTHPQYISTLFTIYDSAGAEASDRALWELDKLFAKATAHLGPESEENSLIKRWFGTEIDAEPVDPKLVERERVEVYRKFWIEELRTEPEAESGSEEESGDAGTDA